MFYRNRKLFVIHFALILALLGGAFWSSPVRAGSDALPRVNISTPSYPVGMTGGESKLVSYTFTETGNVSGEFTSRIDRFYTQYDVPLSDFLGPYSTSHAVNALQSSEWNELVYLPRNVVKLAREMGEYALVLKTTFTGTSSAGAEFRSQASLLILLPPDAFGKDLPANGASIPTAGQSLHWSSSVGAIDYEYCFDTVNNNSCDTDWTGTYWLGTYDTNAALQNLPAGTTFYWQVRANNMAGTTYANNGGWWSFATCTPGPITVGNIQNSGPGSLRQAIMDICPGGTINFDASLGGQTIILSSGSFPAIDKTLTIDGGSGSSVILSGVGSYRIFEVTPAGNLTLNNLTIRDGNYTSWCSGGLPGAPVCAGGAIYSEGALTITNSVFTGNAADAGGAIFIAAGTGEISNSTFVENSANSGGAVFTWTGTAAISNSTFFDNSAVQSGGAVYSEMATLTLANNTFSNNSATTGGGLYNVGMLNLTNNILANSASGADCFNEDGAGILVTDAGNLVEVNAAATNNCGTPAVTGDPNLGPLANNGGFTRTMALLPGSPAIDAGSAASCQTADQRGVSRPQGSACDIGAFEYVEIATATPTSTSTPTSTPSPTSTPTATLPPASNPLYLSLTGSLPVGGISTANEDILYFDGTSWSLFFDGSDVGLASLNLADFSIVGPDTILMVLSTAGTVDGIAVTPQDILLFDASSLGSNTAGTFSLYFDGSDVGLEDATNEKIDALASVPDGHLLISTTGSPSVPGVSGARDEDLLLFTSTTLGDTTSGSWSLYFDGSDVGLGETSGEDIDALDLLSGDVYLSTTDNFSVPGLSGADEDVFVCELASTGETTACTYQTSLYFDGSTWGLDANDVDAFHFPAAGPIPTAVPTNTPTPTGTATPTMTATATATSTGGSGTFTFAPVADAYVNVGSPASNYGASTTLRADASPDLHSYLRFNVQGVSGTVTNATLRVYANSSSSLGYMANAVSNNTWSEATINYNNAPIVGNALGSSGLFGAGVWVEIDVTGYITGNGTYTLALTTTSSTALSLASRESANPPQLIVEVIP